MNRLLGLTLTKVKQGDNSITFEVDDGRIFELYHEQDCCESVYIEDVVGDLQDLIGSPILESEESYQAGDQPEDCGTSTWSFYKIGTIKGHVNIRFFGSSNGYYGETASLQERT